jgi:hypothetical protein
MSCIDVREMFSGYLDGAISGREMQAMSLHLEACLGCQSEFDAWRGVQHGGAGEGSGGPWAEVAAGDLA